ncbi:MAG: addiction module protein [Leptolyngbyaceae cyanobacterium SL_5_9]|nr:addiction module protein [Leptolyngbyaceae cyanobacterium SL_5_9]NJO73938.1 addiction module protein [Leptolyngbyaceae cyanobacterium RM1_406_9]
MDLTTTLAQVKTLSVDDRIRLVQAIWDSISAEPEQLELAEAQQLELSRRLSDYESNPQAVVSWQEIKAQALSRAKADT